jgi:hypothetical protein
MNSESKIQSDCFLWHWNNYPKQRGMLYMIFNNPKSGMQGANLKSMGLLQGVADMEYKKPDGTTLHLECKTDTGKQSDYQKWFEAVVKQLGNEYAVYRNLEEFIKLLEPHLNYELPENIRAMRPKKK